MYAGIWQNPAGMHRIPAAKSKRKITFQPVYDPVVFSSTNLYDRLIGKLRLSTRIVATNYGEPSCCNIQYMDVHGWSGKWPKWSSINPASTICIGSSIANKHLNKEPRATLFGQHVKKLQWKKQTWVLSVYAYCIYSTSILHLYSIYTRYILIPYNIYIYICTNQYIYIWYDINPNLQHFHGRSCPTLHLVLDCVIIQELHQVYVALSLAPGERRKVVGGISICCCLWYIWCYIYIIGFTTLYRNHISIYLPTYLSICLSVYLSVCLSIYRSIYLSVYLSAYRSMCQSIYCLSIDVCMDGWIVSSYSIYVVFVYFVIIIFNMCINT
jgi:hypothetical protein